MSYGLACNNVRPIADMWASRAEATARDFTAKHLIIFLIMLDLLYVSVYGCRVGSVRDCSSEQQLGKTTAKLTYKCTEDPRFHSRFPYTRAENTPKPDEKVSYI
jgi:hypothetical protein